MAAHIKGTSYRGSAFARHSSLSRGVWQVSEAGAVQVSPEALLFLLTKAVPKEIEFLPTYIYIYIYMYMHIHKSGVYIYTVILYVYIHVYIYIHIYIHTRLHVYMYVCSFPWLVREQGSQCSIIVADKVELA